MLDYILKSEIRNSSGTMGGWALNLTAAENGADVDITGMVLQALAPYYLDEEKYKESGATTSYEEFQKAVERGIYSLYQLQNQNGGFGGWGSNINAESTVQVIVALTALNMDPKEDSIELANIGLSCSFVTRGSVADGVWTNNMIDALLSFWAKNSGSSEAVGGFKHVVSGNDGGGGSGYEVNAMATDQTLYGLIAYDRFLNGMNSLYDMTDMTDGSYEDMMPASYTLTYDGNDVGETTQESYSPYAEVTIAKGEDSAKGAFVCWNSKADGSGDSYWPGDVLSMPEENITLYARGAEFAKLELNGGTLADGVEIPSQYTPMDKDIVLPTAGQITKEGYEFKGWYTNASLSGTPVTVLERGSYGDKTFYAKWSIVYEKINELASYVTKLNLGNITMSDRNTIKKARAVYDSMTEAEKNDSGCKAYYKKLVEAEKELKLLEESMDAAEIVISLIDNLGDAVTLEQQEAVQEARAEYDALTEEQRELITNYGQLVAAEETIEILLQDKAVADAVTEQIRGIGEVTLDSQQAIADARAAYNDLTESQKSYITEYNVNLLTKAEETLSALQEQAERVEKVQEAIGEIPEEVSLEDDSFQLAAEAKAAYIALTDEERSMIDSAR
ncbi:MAG: InlB B-repeat-containing protein [Blautia sp.]